VRKRNDLGKEYLDLSTRQLFATLAATVIDNFTAISSLHSFAKAMNRLTTAFTSLVCAFHCSVPSFEMVYMGARIPDLSSRCKKKRTMRQAVI
jgi:hypothetical protein